MDLAQRICPVRDEDAVQVQVQGPGTRDQGDHPWDEILADRPGCLVWIDYRMLVSWVMENDAVITADRSVSDFLVAGQPLTQVW